jgi:hypothetical protein
MLTLPPLHTTHESPKRPVGADVASKIRSLLSHCGSSCMLLQLLEALLYPLLGVCSLRVQRLQNVQLPKC